MDALPRSTSQRDRRTATGPRSIRESPSPHSRGARPMSAATDHEHRFWSLADPLLHRPNVTRFTMMGLPCLRVDGAFFASWDRNSGALLVKLPGARVDELVEAGRAEPFAPAGRRFREWAAIPTA